MLTTIVIAALTVTAPGDAPDLRTRSAVADPYIEVWMNEDELFRRGDRARIYFRTDVDAYVTLFRVDTDGRVRVLFPLDPWDDNFTRGGQKYEIHGRHGGYAFRVDDYPGEGYVFAVASADPFTYTGYVVGNHWDYRTIGNEGRITGDPYVAFGDILTAIIPPNYVAYSYDVVPYFVEQRYDYPRFVCYDCHAYAAYPYWDPYRASCFKFRLVIYDDPYYYPARVYVGTRVVYRRRTVTVPRYVFKDRAPNDNFVVRVRERPIDNNGRRRIAPGATGRDLGGIGRVPAPARRDVTSPADPVRRRVESPRATPERRPLVQPRLERREPERVVPRRNESSAEPRRSTPSTERRVPSTPQRAEPRRVEPRGATPSAERRAPSTPQRAEPRRVEPRRSTPNAARRAPNPPSRAAPSRTPTRKVEPSRTPTRRTQPASPPSRKVEPRRGPRRSPPQRKPPRKRGKTDA